MGLRPMATGVKPLDNFEILVSFDNGEKRIFDVKMLMKQPGWFDELKDPAVFATVHVAGLSVEWDSGHDVCPDDLYYLSRPVKEQ